MAKFRTNLVTLLISIKRRKERKNRQQGIMSWSAPTFAENFEPVKFQQGYDAHFVATVAGNPKPEVREPIRSIICRLVIVPIGCHFTLNPGLCP